MTLLQKPGNYHDDSRLTNSVRNADTLEAALADLKWEHVLIVPAYYLNQFFEVGTNGRRVIASLIVLSSFIYLLVILSQYRVLDKLGLLLFAFLFASSGGLTIYSSIGLLGYPLLIFLSVILIHVLLRFDGHSLSLRSYLAISTIFTLAVLVNNRIILGVCAAGFVLAFGDLFQHPVKFSDLFFRFRRMLALLLAPILMMALFLYFYTHPELTNPYRAQELYFLRSSYPNTIIGAIHFFTHNSINLFLAAMSPHPYAIRPAPVIWVNATLGIFFLIGLITARNKKAVCIALFFLAGTLGHVILNLSTLVPYGNLRYFLPFYVAYPVLTAYGVMQAAQGSLRCFEKHIVPVSVHRRVRFSFIILTSTVIVILAILLRYQYINNGYNSVINYKVVQGISAVSMAKEEKNASVVLDTWTKDTLRADQWEVADDPSYVLQTNIKSGWQGRLPGSADDRNIWRTFLSGQDAFTTITSVPFSKKYYGPIYETAFKDFETVSWSSAPLYHFKEFSKRKDAIGTSPLNVELSKWQLQTGISFEEVSPPPSLTGIASKAYKVSFAGNDGGSMKWVYPLGVRSGQSLSAIVYLWSDAGLDLEGDLIFQIARDDHNKNEFANKRVEFLDASPKKLRVGLKFEADHDTVRVALIYRGDMPVSIHMSPVIFQQ